MPRPPLTAQQRADQDRRQRTQVLEGLAQCIADNGYASTTMADVAAAARVSKSTVYAHFSDKEHCFLALYSAATDKVLAVIEDADGRAAAEGLCWSERVQASTSAYFEAMAAGQDLTRCLLIEVQAVSPRARGMRREVLRRYARLLQSASEQAADADAGVVPLTPALALGVVGGISELMLEAIEDGGAERLRDITPDAVELLVAVAGAAARTQPA